tara:strand:+ start:11571 stop:13007 length:1437 start_codon:yes stop_codon:yes gene_type:complete
MSYHNTNTGSSTQSTQRATRQSQQNILTYIDSEPLFRTIQQALDYGQSVGLQGYHTHTFRGDVGYMAGFNHSQAVTGATQEEVLKKITALDIKLSNIAAVGENRSYSIIGDDGASFILQVVKDGSEFYNFTTKSFVSAFTSETMIKSTISGTKSTGAILFPASGSSFNVLVMANPSDDNSAISLTNSNSVINKSISRVVDSVLTFALSTTNTNSYATLPTLATATGSKTKSYNTDLNRDFDVSNNAHDSYGFGLKLTRQPIEKDFIFRQQQTVDGATSSSTSVVLGSVENLSVGMFLTSISGGSLSGTPVIKAIDTATKTLTLSSAQTFIDGRTADFDARGFDSIRKATGASIDLISLESEEDVLTKTVRTDSDGDFTPSTTITLNGTYGISKDCTISGAEVDRSSSNAVTNVNSPSSTAGEITVSLAQTLRANTKLYFTGSTQKIKSKLRLKVKRYPSSNKTITILLDNFITPGTQS